MKTKLLTMSGLGAVLVLSFLLWRPLPDARVTDQLAGDAIAEHPDYFKQWFEMKKDENGQIPSGMHARWYAHDQMKAAENTNKVLVNPISTTTFLGPTAVGGRTRALMIDAANESRIFAGCISGGLWRSTNGGTSWAAVNDAASSLAVSCITQNPLNSSVIYYGTGESRANSSGVPGDGIFKSTNGGSTFTQLSATTSNTHFDYCWAIAHAKNNTNTVYVGTNSGGLYRTTDAGTTWSQVYSSGAITDIVTFANGSVMFTSRSNGIYFSTTGNSGTFTQQTDADLPTSGFYRVEIQEYKANDNIVYAAFEATAGGCLKFLKSTDKGTTWVPVSIPAIGQTYTYYCFNVGVSANNSNRITCAGVNLRYSTNGGTTWLNAATSHADHHSFAAYSGTPDNMLIGNDGGVFRFNWTTMSTYTDLNNGYYSTQFYAGDYAPTGDITIGGTQDNGTHRVGTNYKKLLGGDGAFSHVSLQNGALAYQSYQNGAMNKSTNFTATTPTWTSMNTNATMNAEGYDFVNAYQINYADGANLYCRTASGLWRTTNSGTAWTKASGSRSGLFAIGVTRVSNPTVYFGGSSANIYRLASAKTATAGTEVDLSASVPASVTNDYIGSITPHPSSTTTLYVGFSNFTNNPRAWKVTNSTSATPTWTSISGDLPTQCPVNYIQADPSVPDLVLFAGTDFGLYYTTNGGTNWFKHTAVPNVSIHEIKMRTSDRTLWLFTHGRGIWKLTLGAAIARMCNNTVQQYPYQEDFRDGLTDWELTDELGNPWNPETSINGGDYAHLSQCFDFGGLKHPVVEFDFNPAMTGGGNLSLEIGTEKGAIWNRVWSQSGDRLNEWRKVVVDLAGFAETPDIQVRWVGDVAQVGKTIPTFTDFVVREAGTQVTDGSGNNAQGAMASIVAEELRVFPSPFNQNFTIALPDGDFGTITARMYDLSGKLVKTITGLREGSQADVNTDGIAPGTYVLTVDAAQFHRAMRIVKAQ